MFCPKCGSLLRPKKQGAKRVFACSCGYKSNEVENTRITESVNTKSIEVMEEVETKPIVEAKCEKCGHDKAYYWTLQTRASDEPETRFYKCVKCRHTWREYK